MARAETAQPISVTTALAGTILTRRRLAAILEKLELDFLHFREPLPLMRDLVVDLLVQQANLEFGFQIDLVVIFSPEPPSAPVAAGSS